MKGYKYLLIEEKSFPNTQKNRFYSKVTIPQTEDGCMIWNLAKNRQGYGVMVHEVSKTMLAHRYSYELFVGEIPDGMCVLHKCDNPLCVRPDHLFLGSHSDNMQDMFSKGRGNTFNNVKLDMNKVKDIRKRLENKESRASIAKSYNVCVKTITDIKLNKSWKAVS
jgi:hypothetical protein